jgi:spore coat polysaccharide biosynthesis protein SpsF
VTSQKRETKILMGIQARSHSTRLPGKIYETLLDRSILEWTYRAAMTASEHLTNFKIDSEVYILGPQKDVQLKEFCEKKLLKLKQPKCAENDLIERYSIAANDLGATHIVRVTADCPLIDPGVIADISKGLHEGLDYISNTIHRTFLEGLDCQGVSYNALIWVDANQKTRREHPFIDLDFNLKVREDFETAGFRLEELRNPQFSFLQKAMSVDTAEDLNRVRRYIDDLKKREIQSMAREAKEHPRPGPHLSGV